MSLFKRYEEGVTLLEVLLVLAIAMSIFVMSLRLYTSFRRQADILSVRTNIDTLFQAAAKYYQANCSKGGELDPIVFTDTVKPLNITTDLINNGYLDGNFPIPNPLVNPTGSGNGYVVQFNRSLVPRMQSICSDPPTCALTAETQIGTIVIWKIQVSVSMQNTNPTQLEIDKNMLLADCLSKEGIPCSAGTPGYFIVFERLPSYATSDWRSESTYWITNPVIKQFQQMYTTNPMTDLTGKSHTPEYQYFYCSG